MPRWYVGLSDNVNRKGVLTDEFSLETYKEKDVPCLIFKNKADAARAAIWAEERYAEDGGDKAEVLEVDEELLSSQLGKEEIKIKEVPEGYTLPSATIIEFSCSKCCSNPESTKIHVDRNWLKNMTKEIKKYQCPFQGKKHSKFIDVRLSSVER